MTKVLLYGYGPLVHTTAFLPSRNEISGCRYWCLALLSNRIHTRSWIFEILCSNGSLSGLLLSDDLEGAAFREWLRLPELQTAVDAESHFGSAVYSSSVGHSERNDGPLRVRSWPR